MNIVFYPPWLTRLLGQRGIRIWQGELLQEVFDLDKIEAEEKREKQAMSEKIEKLAKKLYKGFRQTLADPADCPRWRDLHPVWRTHFLKVAECVVVYRNLTEHLNNGI